MPLLYIPLLFLSKIGGLLYLDLFLDAYPRTYQVINCYIYVTGLRGVENTVLNYCSYILIYMI